MPAKKLQNPIVLTISNHKGGIGKTSITKLLGLYFAEYQQKNVLLIDLDPQASLSQSFLQMERGPDVKGGIRPPTNPDFVAEEDPAVWERSSSGDIYLHKESVLPYQTEVENLEIIPAYAPSISRVELFANEHTLEEQILRCLYKTLKDPELESNYDIVIIDTGPELKPVALSAIRAADFLLIPVEPERKCVENLPQMMDAWRTQNRKKPTPIHFLGILINKLDKRMLVHTEHVHMLEETYGEYLIPQALRKLSPWINSDLPELDERSVLDYPASNDARKEALAVCEYVNEKIYGDRDSSNELATNGAGEELVEHG